MKMLTAVLALVLGGSSGEDAFKMYRIVFAGVVHELDCPESPSGHTLSWVNQNCRGLAVRPPSSIGAVSDSVIVFNASGIGTTQPGTGRPRRQ